MEVWTVNSAGFLVAAILLGKNKASCLILMCSAFFCN